MAVIDKEKVRQWLGVNDWVPGSGMPLLDVIVDASINAIADACGRTFDVVDDDTEDTARIFPGGHHEALIDDMVGDATLVEGSWDRVTWTEIAGTWLGPDNQTVRYRLHSPTCLPTWVRVTGTYGVDATLAAKAELATLMKAAKLWKRKDTPNGVEGFADFGVVRVSTREDPDIMALIAPLRRMDRVAGVA